MSGIDQAQTTAIVLLAVSLFVLAFALTRGRR